MKPTFDETAFDDRTDRTTAQVVAFPRRSQMSTIAATHALPAGAGVRRPARRPAASPSVRLTRRGRVVLVVLFVGLLLAAFLFLGDQVAATGEQGRPVDTRTVVVGEGQTLWGIASEVAGPGETREMIHRIQELNALPDASLQAGQRLAVPVD